MSFKKEYSVEIDGKKYYFDFIVNNSYIIEFDGQQHFQYTGGWNTRDNVIKTHNSDLIKNNYCFKNNIPLIRIPYTEEKQINLFNLTLNSPFLFNSDKEREYYDKYYIIKEELKNDSV